MASDLSWRRFLSVVGRSAAATLAACHLPGCKPRARPDPPSPECSETIPCAETAVKTLYDSLTDGQKREICFDWDHRDKRGLLRTFVANHWQVTRPAIRSDFYTRQQQILIHDIFRAIINPDWHGRVLKQLHDDTSGHPWGTNQSIALFGRPGTSQFEFVITGRHLTLRADGNSDAHVAFGGPIFYGHDAGGQYYEKPHHPGNVFWPQAVAANRVFETLDGKHRAEALLAKRPVEPGLGFRGKDAQLPGIPVCQMSSDQKSELQSVLRMLLEPFRIEERSRVVQCLEQQGGLDTCHLAFYEEDDLGDDRVWDNWRLEGPAFIWYFRGAPHVHVWVHVADNPQVAVNARTGVFLHPEHDRLGAPESEVEW